MLFPWDPIKTSFGKMPVLYPSLSPRALFSITSLKELQKSGCESGLLEREDRGETLSQEKERAGKLLVTQRSEKL